MSNTTSKSMRVIHRYLGFFLAGIMAVYALSGIVLIFRDTDFLKKEIREEKVIESNVATNQLGEKLRIKGLKILNEEGGIIYFENGFYDSNSGQAEYLSKKLPSVLEKMTHLHKANTSHPLFWLNIFFGSGLLFFVVSTFWMFRPSSSIFKKGLYFTAGGVIVTIILLFYG